MRSVRGGRLVSNPPPLSPLARRGRARACFVRRSSRQESLVDLRSPARSRYDFEPKEEVAMKRIPWKPAVASTIALALSVAGIHALKAQQAAPTVKRNIIFKQDMS